MLMTNLTESLARLFCACFVLLFTSSLSMLYLSAKHRRPLPSAFTLLLSISSYVLLVFSLMLIYWLQDGAPVPESGVPDHFKGLNAMLYTRLTPHRIIALISVVAAVVLYLLLSHLQWQKSNITVESIRDCGDRLPAGLLYWLQSGRILFANEAMYRLNSELNHTPLLDGAEFYAALPGAYYTAADGTIRHFVHRTFDFKGSIAHELVANDVTELYTKTLQLQEAARQAQRLSEKLLEYNLRIDDTVRREEILQAQIGIHDEANRLMLAASATIGADTPQEEREQLLRLWKNNSMLISHKQDSHQEASGLLKECQQLASLLGTEFSFSGTLPLLGQKALELVRLTAKECITNAVKHGHAGHIAAVFMQNGAQLICAFENDGRAPTGEVVFTGGLAMLERQVRDAGGSLTAQNESGFQLTLTVPMDPVPAAGRISEQPTPECN